MSNFFNILFLNIIGGLVFGSRWTSHGLTSTSYVHLETLTVTMFSYKVDLVDLKIALNRKNRTGCKNRYFKNLKNVK